MHFSLRRGFTLVECIACLLVLAFLLAGFYSLLAAAFSSSQLPSVTLNGITYAKAPNIGQMNAAINAQMLFQQLEQSSDASLVFGGKGSHPILDPAGPSDVIDWDSWSPLLFNPLSPIDPSRQFSSWDQRMSVGALTPPGSPADFSVLFVQGLSRVIGLAKQRRLAATLNCGPVNCYDVMVKAFDSTGAVSDSEEYHIYFPAGEDSWRIAPGAEHIWFRYDPLWSRDEEAGALVVFADPYVVAGENPDSEVLPVSEFTFYVPLVN
jgi:prepilin-type N-terminal cleavage/methylation domain-containing protein